MATLKDGRYTVPEQEEWTAMAQCRWTFGTDNQTHKKVFIKEFLTFRYPRNPEGRPNLMREQQRTEAFERRIRKIGDTIGRIAQNGGDVVVTTDFFREDVYLYKVTDKIEMVPWKSEEIYQHIPVEMIDEMMQRMVNAIGSLHQVNLLHCDLKPDNVFVVERNGRYVGMVSDFDDSFFMDDIPCSADVVGTPEYMSPELGVYKNNEMDEPPIPLQVQSDIFAIGLIYHVFLTGKMPSFDEDYYNGQLWSVMFDEEGTYSLSDDLDIAHRILLNRMLQPVYAMRISNCVSLAAEIGKIRNNRNRTYCVRMMNDDSPIANSQVEIYATYKVGYGEEAVEITDKVLTTRTDARGMIDLKGLPADAKYAIKYGGKTKELTWKDNGGVQECSLQFSEIKQFYVRVLLDNAPKAGVKVCLIRVANGKSQSVPEKKTNAQGQVVYQNLPDGEYFVVCGKLKSKVTWNAHRSFDLKLRSCCVKVVRGDKPVAGASLSLYLPSSSGGRRLFKEGETGVDGAIRFIYADDSVQFCVVCEGKEEKFSLPSNGQHVFRLPADCEVTLRALVMDENTPISGVRMVIARKVNDKMITLKAANTDGTGKIVFGAFEPGEYFIGVVSAPEGCMPVGLKFKQPRKVELSGESKAFKVRFKKEFKVENVENVVSDEMIPGSVSSRWGRIIRYNDGSIVLVARNGQSRKTNNNCLGLFGLDIYRR